MSQTQAERDAYKNQTEYAFQVHFRDSHNRDLEEVAELFKPFGDVLVTRFNEQGVYWVFFESLELDNEEFEGENIEGLKKFVLNR